ncbi:MAG: TonB-dependent receptor [Gemmatimonadales bacterium]|nr:MAG: TonB-dependent receptor [Gemmatimonadales bacterium]
MFLDRLTTDGGASATARSARIARFLAMALAALMAVALAPDTLQAALQSAPSDDVVRGVVVNSDDREPLAGVRVQLLPEGPAALTDAEGRFELRGLSAAEGPSLRFTLIGYRERTVEVSPEDAESVEVALVRSAVMLDEVIATATPTRSGASYQAAQAFNAEQLQRLSGTSLGEMLDGQPGLASRSFGAAPARPVIRGFDGERLLVLQNGERMGDIQETAPDHAVTLDPMAMDRIEVVRGPASLLYGSSAMGGVVNILSRDSPEVWSPGLSGGFSLQGASQNEMGAGSGRLVYGTDRWALSSRLTYRDASDGSTPAQTIPNSYSRTLSTALGLGVRTDRFEGGVSISYHDNDYGVPEFAVEQVGDDEFVEEEPDMEVRIDRLNVSTRARWETGRWLEEVSFRSSISESLQEEGEPDPIPEELELEIFTQMASSTLMLHHRPAGFLDRGVLGFNHLLKNQEVDGIEAYHPGERLTSLAAFTFQEVPLSDRVRLQAGGRLENEWLRTVENRFFPPEESFEDTELNVAWSLGLNVQPDEAWEIGTQVARNHRNPTVLERYADGWHAGATRVELGDPTLQAEIGHGVDLFVRRATERTRMELAAFGNWIDDYIALETLDRVACNDIDYRVRPDRDFPNCVQFFATDARMMGAEAQVDLLFGRHMQAGLVVDVVRGDRRGDVSEPLPFIPPFRTSVRLARETESGILGATVRHARAQDRVPGDELSTAGHTLLNLEASRRLGPAARHLVTIRVDNVLDTRYQDHLSVVRRFPEPVSPDNESRFDMPGRNINVTYRWLF